MKVRDFREDDRGSVIALWETAGLLRPWNNPDLDIDRKMAEDPDGFLVGEAEGVIVATAMVGYDGHRGWVNYLAVDPLQERAGIGRLMMTAAEHHLLARGCPKLNVQVRGANTDAIAFYERIGFRRDDVISLGRRLIPDD
jgi:ribosomal protein S18 acetylase RimI-like enzyme